jgi:hypothetical protein
VSEGYRFAAARDSAPEDTATAAVLPDDAAPPDAAPPAAGRAAATGDPRLDAALSELDRVAGSPPADQVPVYERVHGSLRATLASIDAAGEG